MAGLTRVAVVEFVLHVAGGVLLLLSVQPVGVSIGVIAYKHAKEDHQGHLQEQADDRQPPAEIGVPDHAVCVGGGAWPRRAAGSSDRRSQTGEAYKTRAGAGRPRRVAEQLTQVPPARSPNRRDDGTCGLGARLHPRPPSFLVWGPSAGSRGRAGKWAGIEAPQPLRIPWVPGSMSVLFCSGPRHKQPDCLPPTERGTEEFLDGAFHHQQHHHNHHPFLLITKFR